jgi:NIMA (never in mitosis gene a)-related kinase
MSSVCIPSLLLGKVHKIVRIEDGEVLVWKELYYGTMNTKEKEQLVSEVNILRELSHKHVVRYYDRIIDREAKKIYIVMEYCSGGDVASIIRDHLRQRTWADEEFIWKILTEVASALQECHSKCSGTILHRDLKPANIFLDSPVTKCVKLGDFGLARTLKDSFDYAKTHVGTPFYMSPEQVMETQYNEKSDIWSLGQTSLTCNAVLVRSLHAHASHLVVLQEFDVSSLSLPPFLAGAVSCCSVCRLSRV